jgi:hypothetical protein
MPRPYEVGFTKRTLFATWRVEACLREAVSFPFGGGFGCGQGLKVNQGSKQSIQTQWKFSSQTGVKVPGPVEFSTSSGMEESVTLAYEFTNAVEWSYTALPCEYCRPRIVFPNAVTTIWSKRPLHLPLFVSKRTTLDPGGGYEIQGNCRRDPERCRNCPEVTLGPGATPMMSVPKHLKSAHVERVMLADRAFDGSIEDLADDLSTGKDEQLYVVGLDGRPHNVEGGLVLASIDEVDRALGSVRIGPGRNRLIVVTEAERSLVGSPEPVNATLLGDTPDKTSLIETEFRTVSTESLNVISVDVDLGAALDQLAGDGDFRLRLDVGHASAEWPVTGFSEAAQPSPPKSRQFRFRRREVASSEEP